MTPTQDLGRIPNATLVTHLRALVAESNRHTARLIRLIAEAEHRRLHLDYGYRSLVAWCATELNLSEGVAFKRIRVARLAREYPLALRLLAANRTNVTALVLVAPHLQPDNHAARLEAVCGKSRRQVEELIATWAPKPPKPATVRRQQGLRLVGTQAESAKVATTSSRRTVPRAAPVPVAADRYAVRFEASARFAGKLEEVKGLMAHTDGMKELAAVLEAAVDLLIEKKRKQRFGVGASPRGGRTAGSGNGSGGGRSRYMPMAVRREVYERDGGRCTWEGVTGRRCEGRDVEIDHVEAYALGGGHEVGNLRLLCRAHNQEMGRRVFGSVG